MYKVPLREILVLMADGNGKVVNSDIYEPLLSVAWRGADALI